jgi:protein-disulfide isomerase
MKTFVRYAIPLALALTLSVPAPAAKKDEGITREQADQILNELRQIRELLEQQPKTAAPKEAGPKRAKLTLQPVQTIGNKDAPLTMVEFTDFQCPFCKQFYSSTFPDLKKNYIDTGKMRFYSRDLPLDFHPDAMRAAQAGRCAAEQGQFWKMRDLMAANPDKLDLENLVADAGDLKLDVRAFRACVESQKTRNAVQTDVMEAMKTGAEGTPAFVVGKSTPDGVDGELIVGAMPYDTFDQALRDSASK